MISNLVWHFKEYWVGYLLLLLIVALASVGVVAIKEDTKKQKRLMSECMRDGHKEWQCHSWLKSESNDSLIMFMPMHTGRSR